jgi:hypothetical protein
VKIATVTKGCLMCYGSSNKAWITLNKGQIWSVVSVPNKPNFPWYTIKRDGVVIDVWTEDMKRYFRMEDRG